MIGTKNTVFSEYKGRKNVICFKNMMHYIANEKWYENRKTNIDEAAQCIILVSAKLIREEIRSTVFDNIFYPFTDDIKKSKKTEMATYSGHNPR